MGLDFKDSEARWSYSGFNAFRDRLAREIGIELKGMYGHGGILSWKNVTDAIVPLLDHSDCEGELSAKECKAVAPRLLELIRDWPEHDYDRVMATILAKDMQKLARKNKPLVFC